MPKGQPVTVLSLVPLAPAEYDEAAGAGSEWPAEDRAEPGVRFPLRARRREATPGIGGWPFAPGGLARLPRAGGGVWGMG